MTDIKIVVGANFGDEGKGGATDYFTDKFIKQGKSCLNVLSNGGAQRGHTVDTTDGKHHIFKHFGSGTFAGANTYMPVCFIVNPMEFRKEYEELKQIIGIMPFVYVNPLCKFTTPWDMMVNQIVEESRGENKHGSCGMGIWETESRYNLSGFMLGNIFSFWHLNREEKITRLCRLRDGYFIDRLKQYGINEVPEKWKEIYYSPVLIQNYIDDVSFFTTHVRKATDFIIKYYDSVVFENGQGLLLDQNLMDFYGDNTTPSNTGSINVYNILKSVYPNSKYNEIDIELCYVTRSYMTRHGVGRFETECGIEHAGSNISIDTNNVTNEFQGELRYGELILDNLVRRVTADSMRFNDFPNVKTSIMVTHTNENLINYSALQTNTIQTIYTSNNKYNTGVKQL